MHRTLIGRMSEVVLRKGIDKSIPNPIKPEWFAGRHEGRLTKPHGLMQFGVNYLKLEPGSATSLRHWHEGEDEFVCVLKGQATLIDDNGEHQMQEGAYVSFPAGVANGHHLVNHSGADVELLVVGSRKPGEDACHYPDESLGRIPR